MSLYERLMEGGGARAKKRLRRQAAGKTWTGPQGTDSWKLTPIEQQLKRIGLKFERDQDDEGHFIRVWKKGGDIVAYITGKHPGMILTLMSNDEALNKKIQFAADEAGVDVRD